MPREWALTGRAEELGFLEAAMRRSGALGLVLAGPAGVGKTRLAREALALGRARRMLVRWVVGSVTARALPLGAFAGLVELPEGDSAIADRLVVSVRTVEGHIYRASTRLGLSRRADLTALLQDG